VNAFETLRIEMQSIASDLILMNINDGCVRLSIHLSRTTAFSDNFYAPENSWLVKVQSESASLVHSATHSPPNPIHAGELSLGLSAADLGLGIGGEYGKVWESGSAKVLLVWG
jgi:hypothetical protein